jgi:hypothetical protein
MESGTAVQQQDKSAVGAEDKHLSRRSDASSRTTGRSQSSSTVCRVARQAWYEVPQAMNINLRELQGQEGTCGEHHRPTLSHHHRPKLSHHHWPTLCRPSRTICNSPSDGVSRLNESTQLHPGREVGVPHSLPLKLDPSAHGLEEGLGLLMDLFLHVVLISTLRAEREAQQ